MDFHSLQRRELQALCKKNKIPANVTNAAMADHLKSLAIVEGIDEVLQKCNSEMAQLSIEPRVRMEAASPLLPPTGGRSTRRRNPPKEETSRRLTRNANESQVDAFETPVAPQTNRKKVQVASACRKMDSLFKECAEEKKDAAVLTPAPWGVTNPRRRAVKEDSAVKVQGTRRSARLAEKSAKLLKGHESGHELNLDGLDDVSVVTDVSASTNLDECSAEKDEEQVDSAKEQDVATDVETVVDAVTIGEENYEKKIQAEFVPFEKQVHPAEEQDISTGVETVVDTITVVAENPEKEIQSEVFQCEKQVGSTVEEVDQVPSYEGESDYDVETVVDAVTIGEENHEKKIQAEFVPCEKQVVCTVKKDEHVHPAEEQDIATGVETVVDAVTVVAENPGKIIQSEIVQCEKHVVSAVEEEEQVPSYEGESDSETDDAIAELKGSIGVSFEQVAFVPKIAAEFDDQNCAVASKDANIAMALNLNNGAQETDGFDVIETFMTKIGGAPEYEEADIECEDDFAFSDSDDEVTNVKDTDPEEVTPFGVKEELELNTDMHDPDEKKCNPVDSVISEPMEESTKTNDSLDDIDEKILVKDDMLKSTALEDIAADEPEIVQPEENDKTGDQVFLGASSYLTDAPLSEEAPTQQLAGVENEAVHQLPPSSTTLDPPVSTQIRASASKESIQKRIIAAASNNKENINSGSKTRHAKERSKFVMKDIAATVQMDDQTMWQLSYDVAKLEISQKLDKNIDGVTEVPARPALQEIQKNQ